MDNVRTMLEQLKIELGPRPAMPEGWEESDELTWRHGACFEWDKIVAIIERKLLEI